MKKLNGMFCEQAMMMTNDKRCIAANLLATKTWILRFFADRSKDLPNIDAMCTCLSRCAQEFNDDLAPGVSKRYDVYYRNHIYPAEIEKKDSVFYEADIRLIDAILIDRDPHPAVHHRHRGGNFVCHTSSSPSWSLLSCPNDLQYTVTNVP
jgi:hypothetical protein